MSCQPSERRDRHVRLVVGDSTYKVVRRWGAFVGRSCYPLFVLNANGSAREATHVQALLHSTLVVCGSGWPPRLLLPHHTPVAVGV